MAPIVIKDLFYDKNPKLAKAIPNFIYNYLNRIIHIDEVNELIKKYGNLEGVEFAKAVVKHLNVTKEIVGLENIPKDGRFIFTSNHPLGGFDAMLLMDEVNNHTGDDLRFLANDVLTEIKPLANTFIPINKFGGNAKSSVQISNEAYDSDMQILIFPSGLISRKNFQTGVIKDREWRKHFVQKSIQYQRDVIPVHISGRNTNFFYFLANLRRISRLKTNIEMLYLADEFFKQKNMHFKLTFGSPISYKTFDKSKTKEEWANYVREISYSLDK